MKKIINFLKKIINFFKKNSISDNLVIAIDSLAALVNLMVGFSIFSLNHILIGLLFILIVFQSIMIINYREITNQMLKERKEIIDACSQLNR